MLQKGLEYKSVFVVGMEEDLFPSFMSKEDPNGMEEERRLFYVAITRAEAFLTLTYAESRYRFGKMKFHAPSRFLEEISTDHLESFAPLVSRRMTYDTKPSTSGVQGNFSRTQRMGANINGGPKYL